MEEAQSLTHLYTSEVQGKQQKKEEKYSSLWYTNFQLANVLRKPLSLVQGFSNVNFRHTKVFQRKDTTTGSKSAFFKLLFVDSSEGTHKPEAESHYLLLLTLQRPLLTSNL